MQIDRSRRAEQLCKLNFGRMKVPHGDKRKTPRKKEESSLWQGFFLHCGLYSELFKKFTGKFIVARCGGVVASWRWVRWKAGVAVHQDVLSLSCCAPDRARITKTKNSSISSVTDTRPIRQARIPSASVALFDVRCVPLPQ